MEVTVDYLGHIKRVLNAEKKEKVELKDAASVANLLLLLSEKHGDPFRNAVYEPSGLDLKSNFILTVNGFLLNQLNGIETKLRNGDHVVIMPIVSGG